MAKRYENDLIYLVGLIVFLIILYGLIKGGVIPNFKYEGKWTGLRDRIRSINEPAESK